MALNTDLLIRGGLAIAVAVLMWVVFIGKDGFGEQYYEAASANWDDEYSTWNDEDQDDDYEAEYEPSEAEYEPSEDENDYEPSEDEYYSDEDAQDEDYEADLAELDSGLDPANPDFDAPSADVDYEEADNGDETLFEDGGEGGQDYENDEVDEDMAQEYPFDSAYEPQSAPDPYALLL